MVFSSGCFSIPGSYRGYRRSLDHSPVLAAASVIPGVSRASLRYLLFFGYNYLDTRHPRRLNKSATRGVAGDALVRGVVGMREKDRTFAPGVLIA